MQKFHTILAVFIEWRSSLSSPAIKSDAPATKFEISSVGICDAKRRSVG